MTADAIAIDALEPHRRFLWGLCYRMTGSAADAEDLVQDTFVRALEHPPARADRPWRPWLVRVAMNLAIDLLRRRKRVAYTGPWLPSPVDTASGDEDEAVLAHEPAAAGGSTAARYDLLESVSFAFLVALEALTPAQRAVLLLRDVFDYSVRETAAALGLTAANVKTTHHRARQAMGRYDAARVVPTKTLQARTAAALERFLSCLQAGDVAGLEAMLAADVRMTSDGGGEFAAALRPVLGRERVLRFFVGVARKAGDVRVALRVFNGLPSAVVDTLPPRSRPTIAPRTILQCELDGAGRIRAFYVVSATRKLAALT